MKQSLLLVSLILLGTLTIRDYYKEQPNLADPNNPLSLTCPEYLPTEHNINANPNFALPDAGIKGIDQNWYSSAVENIMKEEYNISYSEDTKSYQSPNRANNLRFIYHKDGFTAKPRETKIPLFDVNDRTLREDEKNYEEIEDWSIELKVENGKWKVDDSKIRIANAGSPPSGGARGGEIEDNSLKAAGNKAWIEDDNIKIDYTNSKQGMRQDFIIKHKPEGDGNLEIVMNASTELQMNVNKDEVKFSSTCGERMQYASLKAFDANGRTLDAYFEKRDEHQFAIVVDDRDAEYPVTVDPLSSTPDWKVEEPVWSVSTAGDVNNDGYSDVIIGCRGLEKAFVYHGSNTGLSLTASWTEEGDQPGSQFGFSVSTAGDVNDDGFDDVIVAAPFYTENLTDQGKIFVYFGSANGLSNDANWTTAGESAFDYLGETTSSAGDVNGDSFSDIVIGTYRRYPQGRAYVFHGSSSGPSAIYNWSAEGDTAWFAYSVACAGDVNGDGYSDVIAGNFSAHGKAYVYHGSNVGLSNSPDWITEGYYIDCALGWSVSSAGDVNGDGYSDVLVMCRCSIAKIFVFMGSASGIEDLPAWSLDLPSYTSYWSGSFAGDANGDGYSDIIIGTDDGRAFLFQGSSNGLSNVAAWEINIGGNFRTVSTAGDVNGDGLSDVVLGNEGLGKAYAYYGKPNLIQITPHIAHVLQYEEYYFNVSLRTSSGIPVSNTEMFLEIKGANAEILDGLYTDDSGNVGYFLIGYNAGIDTIIAHASNVFDTAFIFWNYANPVNIISFTSLIANKEVTLSWSTSTEFNNSGFEIQRAVQSGKLKVESELWNMIGFVSGGGTTNESREYSFTDRNLETGKYKYRLKQLDFNGNFEYFELVEVVSIGIPDKYDLSQNYPNPFNPVTTINYDLPNDGIVTLKVYDILGRELKTLVNEMKTAGYHKIQFNAADLASGAYFYQMKAGDFVAVKKFVVLK